MAETTQQYFQRLMTEAGVPTDEAARIITTLNNPKVSAATDQLIKRGTDDYQAQLGRATAAQQRVNQLENEWYPQAKGQYDLAMRELATAKAALSAYANGGDPNPANPNPNNNNGFDASNYVSKADLEALNAERDRRFATVIRDVATISSAHAAKFGEGLDGVALEKLATDKGLTVLQAYQEMVRPREEKLQQELNEKKTKEAVDAAVRDYASRHKLPVDQGPREVAPVYRNGAAPADIDTQLMEAWNSVTARQ